MGVKMNLEQAWVLVKRQARAWEQGDLDAIGADFAPDGLFIAPGGRWQGADAIRGAAKTFLAGVSAVNVTINRVFIQANQGAVEWTWSEQRRSDGQRHTAEDAIIFEVCEDLIIYWREYFDTANF
jgi:uncharacterized protein (TIGR02246 family)